MLCIADLLLSSQDLFICTSEYLELGEKIKDLMARGDSNRNMYNKKIKVFKKDAEQQNKDYQAISKIAEETNNQIIALQAKHQEDKELFENNIQKLQMSLNNKEDGELIDYDAKKGEKKDTEKAGGSRQARARRTWRERPRTRACALTRKNG